MLKVAGYVVESKIKSLEGYYVNGDSTIEIVVAEDKTFKLYVDGALVDAKPIGTDRQSRILRLMQMLQSIAQRNKKQHLL